MTQSSAPSPQHSRICFGIPTETGLDKGIVERRVALSPAGVRELCEAGAEVVVQQGAGQGAGFADDEYLAAGARIVYGDEEWELLAEGSTLMAFLHLHVAAPGVVRKLLARNLTALGLEAIREEDGS